MAKKRKPTKRKADVNRALSRADAAEKKASERLVRLIAEQLFTESKEYGDPRQWDDDDVEAFFDDFRDRASDDIAALAKAMAFREWSFAMLAQENLQKAIDEAYDEHGSKTAATKFEMAITNLENAAERVVEMARGSKPTLDIGGYWFNWLSPPTRDR